ncbi:unnamed protein product (macronuclear) [Paramecium tetraurelia]|uniref:RING-type domain-containing protein n=1 Tax=Paramecium tetraurelia TaxID=5888 RepID=A0BPP2_PARTE|nr:uncharacterized protein GSPATT00005259001 [Paramecium tetraurelia]CAK60509.1 unnamed protein product [Paramecium tetraurelia]|eukprot:XP_001427907.1 hypothetical protein (macronuclear) [Paramecium tetraurelia strain d4-2]
MFKFVEYKNFEQFHQFLNSHPQVTYQEIIKHPLQEFQFENEFVNPIIVKQSVKLPFQEYINIMHCSNRFVYLGSQKRVQVFDIRTGIKLIQKLEIQNSLIIQETEDCLFILQLEYILLIEISKDFSIIGTYKLEQVQVPFSFLRVINESQKQLDWYEVVIADLKGNSSKIKCNIFKLFNKRNVQFSTQELTQSGSIIDSKQKKFNDSGFSILYELLVLQGSNENYAFLLYQMHNRISIIRVSKTNKETPVQLYNLQNDQIDSGWACLSTCLDNSSQIRYSFCCSYGNVIHLFMYEIFGGSITVDEIGVKQLENERKINGLECCDSDIFVVLFDDGFALVHTTEFKMCENKLNYLNQSLKIKKFNGHFMLGLTEDSFEFMMLQDCRTLLQNQADQLEFRKAMQNAVRIMNGDLLMIKIAPSDQLSELLQKLAFTECLFLGKQKNLTVQSLSEIIKFLIKTKQEHYLFTIISDVTSDLGYKDVFVNTIESLLRQHQIPYIPDQQLYELCKMYQNQQNVEMIHHLVCSTDFHRISSAILITCCEQMKMYNEMIYVCQMSQDFVTPLVKLFGGDQLLEECQKYILSILEGKSFEGKNLTDEQFTIALRSLIQFLFVSENLFKFINKDPKGAIDIIYQFYIGKAQTCIENSGAEIVLKFQVDETESSLFDFDQNNVRSSTHRLMYLSVRKLEFPKSDIWISYLTAKLLIQKFSFSSQVAYETIYTLCRNYEFLLQLNNDILLVNQFIIRVMMSKKLTEQQLSDLEFSASIVKKFSLALVFIYSQQQQYKKAFEAFKIVNPQIRELIFPWIQQLVELRPMILNSQNDEFILEILKYLITIDEQQTYKLIEKCFHQKHFQILSCFQKDFEDQKYFANFISYLFQSQKVFLINDQTKILYLKRLCETQPKQVLQAIKSMNFPLDEALRLAKEFKINQAAAYIHQISGAIKQALDIYINSFLKKIKKSIALLMKKQTLDNNCTDKLKCKLETIIQMILEDLKQNQSNNDDDQTLWMHFVNLYINQNKIRTFIMPNIPQSVKDLLSLYLSEYLARISDKVQVSQIFDQLNLNYPQLPVSVFRQTIYRVVSKFHDDLRTLKETSLIQSNEKYQIIQQLKEINQSAWICNHICQRCQNHIIDSELAIAFTCSHVFHDYCVLKGIYKIPFCDTCQTETSYKIQKERVLKQYAVTQQISESKFLQQMSVNKISVISNQQQQLQTRKDKKQLIKRFDFELQQKYDYSWA